MHGMTSIAFLPRIPGVKSQKVKVTTEAPGDGISDGSDEDGDLRTITTPPKGMIVEE